MTPLFIFVKACNRLRLERTYIQEMVVCLNQAHDDEKNIGLNESHYDPQKNFLSLQVILFTTDTRINK